jgi:hypothetical protein
MRSRMGLRRDLSMVKRKSVQSGHSVSARQAEGIERAYTGEDYDDIWPSRMPSSVRRYTSDVQEGSSPISADVQSLAQQDYYSSYPHTRKNIPARRTATQGNLPAVQSGKRRAANTEEMSTRQGGRVRESIRVHWLVYVGLALLIMTVGWLLLTIVANWWQVTQDDWRYGRPRTAQYDVVVGHGDATIPSHFIALNLKRHVQIIECPAGDCSKAKIYTGPVLIGQGQDLAPVTLSFKDVTGDGKLDMLVSVQDSRFVFINENGAFRAQKPGETIRLSN